MFFDIVVTICMLLLLKIIKNIFIFSKVFLFFTNCLAPYNTHNKILSKNLSQKFGTIIYMNHFNVSFDNLLWIIVIYFFDVKAIFCYYFHFHNSFDFINATRLYLLNMFYLILEVCPNMRCALRVITKIV